MKGLYFYKLISAYDEDVTKNCKLTVNEIDSNFYNLKEADIIKAYYDAESENLVLVKVGGEKIFVDMSELVDGVVKNLRIDYDSEAGTITFYYNGGSYAVDGLITKDNITDDNCMMCKVATDSTLIGNGRSENPLGINPLERSGILTPASSFLDLTSGDTLPLNPALGDRYVVYGGISEYGYLYPWCGVMKIQDDLECCQSDWRVPSKADWDNMLNEIEPCEGDKNHHMTYTGELGFLAGKYLKSKNTTIVNHEEVTLWDYSDVIFTGNCTCQEEEGCCGRWYPQQKGIQPEGSDKYGMHILAGGYSEFGNSIDYFQKRAGFWTTTPFGDTDDCRIYVKRFSYDTPLVIQDSAPKSALYSVRLVKDYDGSNYRGTEFINGQMYDTVLVPTEGAEHGYSIWTVQNLSFGNEAYMPRTTAGEAMVNDYFVYEWDGDKWLIRNLNEGEAIVINEAYKDMATGIVYPSRAAAIEAGAEETDIEPVGGNRFVITDGTIAAEVNESTSAAAAEAERAFQSEQEMLAEIASLRDEIAELRGRVAVIENSTNGYNPSPGTEGPIQRG